MKASFTTHSGNQPQGTSYRFVVKSASEAVRVIRERLGERAVVTSIKRIKGKGFFRAFSAPMLEVIASVPVPLADLPHTHQSSDERQPFVVPPPISLRYESQYNTGEIPSASGTIGSGKSLYAFLIKSGFDSSLLTDLQQFPEWSTWEQLPIGRVLGELSKTLIELFRSLPRRPLTSRIAFIGTPGSGKTTALCKHLAQEVFVHGRCVEVLKLEGDVLNPDGALSAFCEVIGTTLWREPYDLSQMNPARRLYLDLPGLCLGDAHAWKVMGARLDAYAVTSRILVVNASYEMNLIKQMYRNAQELRATHVVFSHMDEVTQSTKLWPLVLRGGLGPLFLSYGEGITGSYSEDVLSSLIKKTFPQTLSPVPRN
jgi:flagellar biosynthesis protein FlhF